MTRDVMPLSLFAISMLAGCPLVPSVSEDSTSDPTETDPVVEEDDDCETGREASCQNLYDECVLFGGTPEDCLEAVVDYFDCPDIDYAAGAGAECEDAEAEEQEDDGTTAYLDIDCTPIVELDGFDSSIRSIHLSPDAPTVDAYVGSAWVYRSVGAELSFGMSSEFYPSLPGYDLLTVVPTGTTGEELLFGEPTLFFLDQDLNLPAGCYTVVVYDRASDLDVMVLEDDYSPIAERTIRLRAIHAAPSVGRVDLYDVTIPGAPLLLEEDLDFGTAGAVLDLPAEAFRLGLDVDADGRSDLTFDVPELAEGSVVNAFAVEDDAGDIAVIAQLDGGRAVRIDPR